MKKFALTAGIGMLLGGGTVLATFVVLQESGARAEASSIQADNLVRLTEQNAALATKNAALTERLDVCLATTDTYKGYMVENQDLLAAVQEKWGKNYMTPIEGTIGVLQTASDQMECY